MSLVTVIGGTGYVGSAIARRFERAGWDAKRVGRSSQPEFEISDPELFHSPAATDVLIFAAHSRQVDMKNVNQHAVAFSKVIERYEPRPSRIVVISSDAISTGNTSHYCASKLRLEHAAFDVGADVIRPGLVWDENGGGLFETLRKAARFPLVPLPNGGNQLLRLVHIDDLVDVVFRVAVSAERVPIPLVVAHPDKIQLSEIVQCALVQHRPKIVPIPTKLLMAALVALERTGIDLSVTSDSLRSLTSQNRGAETLDAARVVKDIGLRSFPRHY